MYGPSGADRRGTEGGEEGGKVMRLDFFITEDPEVHNGYSFVFSVRLGELRGSFRPVGEQA